MVKLGELAKVVRSKNAGPFLLTIDILIGEPECYERVSRILTKEFIAEIYSIEPSEVVAVKRIDGLNALKIVLKRRIPAGEPGDRDVYGAQQYTPLLEVDVNEC